MTENKGELSTGHLALEEAPTDKLFKILKSDEKLRYNSEEHYKTLG